jgi:hypothetical protein
VQQWNYEKRHPPPRFSAPPAIAADMGLSVNRHMLGEPVLRTRFGRCAYAYLNVNIGSRKLSIPTTKHGTNVVPCERNGMNRCTLRPN